MAINEKNIEIIGYGEDALTLMALINTKGNIMGARNFDIKKILYRPSFGRNQSCLGELDAIIKTKEKLFLVESKWDRSREYKKSKGILVLEKKQVDRNFKIIFSLGLAKSAEKLKISEKMRQNLNEIRKILEIPERNLQVINFILFFHQRRNKKVKGVRVDIGDREIEYNDYVNDYIKKKIQMKDRNKKFGLRIKNYNYSKKKYNYSSNWISLLNI